jgi:hypothetical protein
LLFLDDKFLLQFLRTKKFDIDRVVDLFEKFMLLKFNFPKWFDYEDNEWRKMWELFDSGFMIPLQERDVEGRSVILVQAQKLDPNKFTFADILRLITWIAQVLLEDEETQIAGFVVIADCTNVTLSHYKIFSISDVINFVKVIRQSSVGRHKKMVIINLPSYATVMLEVAKKVMSDKLRQRICLLKEFSELKNEIDPLILPLEYEGGGGAIPESQMLQTFKNLSAEREERIKQISDGVDWELVEFENDKESCTIA